MIRTVLNHCRFFLLVILCTFLIPFAISSSASADCVYNHDFMNHADALVTDCNYYTKCNFNISPSSDKCCRDQGCHIIVRMVTEDGTGISTDCKVAGKPHGWVSIFVRSKDMYGHPNSWKVVSKDADGNPIEECYMYLK